MTHGLPIVSVRHRIELLTLMSLIWLAGFGHAATNILVPVGAVWKFLDDGSNQGTAWRAPEFDDRSWSAGPAQLGYGEADENTELSFGGDPTNKHITSYFRHAFVVIEPAVYSSLTLRLLRDDGAMVFLNGTNVFRSNLPSTVNYRTLASANVGGADEARFFTTNLSPATLRAGTNVLAVEVHQFSTNSPDLSFDLELVGSTLDTNLVPRVIRGPYLQQGTATNIIVRWRTDQPSGSGVFFGTNETDLNRSVLSTPLTNEHAVRLADLDPDTRYYYAVGTAVLPLVGDRSYSFVTGPATARPTRVWVIGDSGTADQRPRSVYQAYTNLTGSRYTDLWLMLGDNAYNTGTDPQYQAAVFDMYPELLRQSVLWPALGNHDTAFSVNPPPTIPYFRIFNLPVNGEAGGIPSGTEKYYSFDYGNIHFVSLDAMASDRSATGPMGAWLEQDLAAQEKEWLIAYWHHPPYTKGSHDSDLEHELVEMRENIVPILEAHGVDLVLCGHSHCYERSFLINGHYGLSGTFDNSMKLDGGSGRPGESGPYVKSTSGPEANRGTVYIVAGSSGQATFGALDHPIMFFDELELGSLILDIDGPVLEARFLRETGAIDDYFTLIKSDADAPLRVTAYEINDQSVTLTWNSLNGRWYRIETSPDLAATTWPGITPLQATGSTLSFTLPRDPLAPQSFYRVILLP